MTGKEKKMNYPEIYQIRISKKLKEKLKNKDPREIREMLEKI